MEEEKLTPAEHVQTKHSSEEDSSPASGEQGRRSEMSVDSGDECDSSNNPNNIKKPKRRRGKSKKKRWKPYYTLTAQERRDFDETEARKADRVRAQRFAHGLAVAPYNTTQFLMEDHDVQEPDLDRVHTQRQLDNCSDIPAKTSERQRVNNNNSHHKVQQHYISRDEDEQDFYYSSPDDEGDFLQKEFSEDYKNAHAERLNSMSKGALVQEYLQLEDRVEKLERELRELRSQIKDSRNESSICQSRSNPIFLPTDPESSQCSSICNESELKNVQAGLAPTIKNAIS